MSLTTRVLGRPDEVDLVRLQWGELAVRAERPFSTPAWALSWWDNLRPNGAELRVVAMSEGNRLVGLLPLFCRRRSYLPLGTGLAPSEPLVEAGREREVAESAAQGLAQAEPRPATIRLDFRDDGADWAGLLGEAWPDGAVWPWRRTAVPVPGVDLGEGFEDWLSGKSSSFRREMKRKRRKMGELGASFRYATPETLDRDVGEFMRLHRGRLAGQGGTKLTDPGVEGALVAVGREMLASDRFRLLCLDLDGMTIGAQVLLVAGREVSAWNSGFDESYAKLSPSIQCIVQALEDASAKGERTMDLGPGAQDYKYRLSNREVSFDSHLLVPPGHPVARLRVGLERIGYWFAGRLSANARARLRRLLRR